jgi:hypothetical protein
MSHFYGIILWTWAIEFLHFPGELATLVCPPLPSLAIFLLFVPANMHMHAVE